MAADPAAHPARRRGRRSRSRRAQDERDGCGESECHGRPCHRTRVGSGPPAYLWNFSLMVRSSPHEQSSRDGQVPRTQWKPKAIPRLSFGSTGQFCNYVRRLVRGGWVFDWLRGRFGGRGLRRLVVVAAVVRRPIRRFSGHFVGHHDLGRQPRLNFCEASARREIRRAFPPGCHAGATRESGVGYR